jgi:hypothetical protein
MSIKLFACNATQMSNGSYILRVVVGDSLIIIEVNRGRGEGFLIETGCTRYATKLDKQKIIYNIRSNYRRM